MRRTASTPPAITICCNTSGTGSPCSEVPLGHIPHCAGLPVDLSDVTLLEGIEDPGHGRDGSPTLMQFRNPSPLNDSATTTLTPSPTNMSPIGRAEPTPKFRPASSTSPGCTSSFHPGRLAEKHVLELFVLGHEDGEVRDDEIRVDVVTEFPDLATERVAHRHELLSLRATGGRWTVLRIPSDR